MMHCSDARNQLEAYALGALEPDEQAMLEHHLETCLDCRKEADALLSAANALPFSLTAVAPLRTPESVKMRVLSTIHSQSATAKGDISADSADADAIAIRPALPTPYRERLVNSKTLAFAAAAILAVVSLVLGVQLSQALDREEALQRQVDEVFARQQEIVLEVVDSNQTHRMILLPTSDDSTSYGKVFTRPDLPHVVAMAARLPEPPEGRRYHLWLTESGRTTLAGVLMLNDQGFGLLVFDADADGPAYEDAVLTLQSPGGEAPAGETVLTWSNQDE